LHKVVNSKNQEHKATLENANLKKQNGNIIITAKEKKADYGSVSVQFDVKAKLSEVSGSYFFIIFNKSGQSSKPIYKSECKVKQEGEFQFIWNTVFTNADILADSDDFKEVMISVYKHDASGNHKKVTYERTALGDIKSKSELSLGKGSNSILISNIKV
jgi:hypothetical protein